MIVAIDGPGGAGKSSAAKQLAKHFSFMCLDTGAMYRAVTYSVLKAGLALDDEEGIVKLARGASISFQKSAACPDSMCVLLNGEDVSEAIRSLEVDRAVSLISAIGGVREAMVAEQQRIGRKGDFIVEGRDIATTVFPDAEVKIFLTASAEARALRRLRQNEKHGIATRNFDEVLADIVRRDEIDSSRSISPLICSPDAVKIDSSESSLEEVLDVLIDLVKKAMKETNYCAVSADGRRED